MSTTKRKTQQDNRIGVWLDHHIAYLVHRNDDGELVMDTMKSKIVSHKRIKGEGSDKTKWGGQYRFSDNESKKNNKEVGLTKSWYKDLQKKLTGFNHILVTGPTTAAAEFHHHLMKAKSFSGKRILQDKSPAMTERQLMAYMKKNLGKPMDILRPEEVI